MQTKTAILSVENLTADAIRRLSEAFERTSGVKSVDFSEERSVAVIEFDPDHSNVDALMRVVLANGCKLL